MEEIERLRETREMSDEELDLALDQAVAEEAGGEYKPETEDPFDDVTDAELGL